MNDIILSVVTNLAGSTAFVVVSFFGLCGTVIISRALSRSDQTAQRLRHMEKMKELEDRAKDAKLIEGRRNPHNG